MYHTYTSVPPELQKLASDLASIVQETSILADKVTRAAERAASRAVIDDLTVNGPCAAAASADAWHACAKARAHLATLAAVALDAATLARNMGGADYALRNARIAQINADHWHARARA